MPRRKSSTTLHKAPLAVVHVNEIDEIPKGAKKAQAKANKTGKAVRLNIAGQRHSIYYPEAKQNPPSGWIPCKAVKVVKGKLLIKK